MLVHADGLTDRGIAAAHFEPVGNVSDAVADLLRQVPDDESASYPTAHRPSPTSRNRSAPIDLTGGAGKA